MLDIKTITDTTKAKQLEWDTTSSSYFNIFLSYNSRFFMSNNSNVNVNSFSKLQVLALTMVRRQVMDGPLKNQVLDLCASSASFLEKKTQSIPSLICATSLKSLLTVCVDITFSYSATTQTKLTNKSILFILVCGNQA